MSPLERTPAWRSFVEDAAYVMGNPRFEIEERHLKLEVARAARLVLERAQMGSGWLRFLDAVLLRHGWRHYFPYARQCEWLQAWVTADSESLRQALCGFLDPGLGPEERFDQFARAAKAAVGEAGDVGAILAFGSLFNFAQEPHTLPLVQILPFRHVQSLLGHEPPRPASFTEKYVDYVQFARQVQELLAAEDVAVADMLDVQGLIFTAARRPHVNAPHEDDEVPASSSPGAEPEVYLSVGAVYRDVAPYLGEWIEFHRLVGVERFFLYDNLSADDHLDVLAPYVADGTVILHEMETSPAQRAAYRHCIAEHRHESRWIAFIDTDEFLFCPAGTPVPEVLTEYEAAPAVGVNEVRFGTSGHRSRPKGLVIENYIAARDCIAAIEDDRTMKSVVDPRRVVDMASPHHFLYSEGMAVDENHYPIKGPGTTYASTARLRLNHYYSKSEEELRAKHASPRADTGLLRPDPEALLSDRNPRYGQPDDAILRYVPALRDALGLA